MTTTNDSQAPTARAVKLTIKAEPEYGSSSWRVIVDCETQADEGYLGVATKTIQAYVDEYWTENSEAFWDDYPDMRRTLGERNVFRLEMSAAEKEEIATAFINYLKLSEVAIQKEVEDAFKDTAEWDGGKTELEFK